MRPRLVFVDDDPQELEDFGSIVTDEYSYQPVHWPLSGSLDDIVGKPPAIFVLDMYFPPVGDGPPDSISDDSRIAQSKTAKVLADRLSHLYDQRVEGKRLLRETFACIQGAYDLLWAQCQELKQSPENGRALLATLKSHSKYRNVPVAFYSRKMTVEEAVRALQAGATAVIPKVHHPPGRQDREAVLHQLRAVQALPGGFFRRTVCRWLGVVNFNVTLFQQDFVQQKAEMSAVKFGG
jgi:CheY-like chemotaxis protein